MRLAFVGCVLVGSGCFDFDRVERTADLSVHDSAVDTAQAPDASGRFPVTCGGIASGNYNVLPVAGKNGPYVSVVSRSDLIYQAYGATSAGEILELTTTDATPLASTTKVPEPAPLSGSYSKIQRIVEDPTSPGSLVIGATGTDSTVSTMPILMVPDGTFTPTVAEVGYSLDVAATSDYLLPIVTNSNGTFIESVARAGYGTEAMTRLVVDKLPRLFVKNDRAIVCDELGLFELTPATGTTFAFGQAPDSAHSSCMYVTAASLSATETRWAYVSSDGSVCVRDADDAPWSCQMPPGAAVAVAIAPCDPDFLFAISSTTAVYESTDGGQSWTTVSAPSPDPGAQPIDVTITSAGIAYFVGADSALVTWQ